MAMARCVSTMVDESENTSIQIKKDTWKRLNMRKEPGDTFDDLVNRLLDATEDEK